MTSLAPLPLAPVRLRPAPRREPPLDDELDALRLAGPLDRPLPFGLLRVVGPGQREIPALPAVVTSSRPDPVVFTRQLVTGLLEAFGGRRNVAQLAPFVSRGIYVGLTRDADTARTINVWRGPAAVRSVHTCEPADGVVEASVVVMVRGRVRAVALRLEWHGSQWRCMRLQLG